MTLIQRSDALQKVNNDIEKCIHGLDMETLQDFYHCKALILAYSNQQVESNSVFLSAIELNICRYVLKYMNGSPDRLLRWLIYNPNEHLFDSMVSLDLIDYNYKCEVLGTSLLWLASYNNWSSELIKKLLVGGADPLQACSGDNAMSFLSNTLCEFKYGHTRVILIHLKDTNQLDKINKATMLLEIEEGLYYYYSDSDKKQAICDMNKLLAEYGL